MAFFERENYDFYGLKIKLFRYTNYFLKFAL